MKNYAITVIILFCIYMFAFILMDYYYFRKSIDWNLNLLISTIFALLFGKILTKS